MKIDSNNISIKHEINIPLGWTTGKIRDLIGEFGLFCDGDWIESKDQDPNGNVRLIQLADIGDGYYRNKSFRFLTKEKANKLKCTFLKPDDLLIARLGEPLGKSCIFPGDEKISITAVDVCIVRASKSDIIHKWLMYSINSTLFRKAIRSLQSGTTRKRISRKNLAKIIFPIPPLTEQHRIVTKIEELLTKLDAGVEALKQAQAQLKRYRQSVLKAAVEGRLTSEWREQHLPASPCSAQASEDELEPADKLIERILKERRENWEAEQLAKYKSNGKKPPKNWQDKYKEPTPPDTTHLSELPEGWVWASLSHIGEFNRGKSKHRPRNDPKLYNGDYPFVQTGDIRYANKFISNYSQTYNEIGLKQSRLWPKGTLCITIAANIADTAILNFDACFPDSIVGFIPNISTNIFFIEYFLRSAKENLDRYAPATAQKNINLKILSELLIPFPPKIEQDEIVNELDCIFSVIDKLDSIIDIELKRSQSLRQSILKRAFEGKLVPQDLNDLPASALLEKIKSEKDKSKKSKQMEIQ